MQKVLGDHTRMTKTRLVCLCTVAFFISHKIVSICLSLSQGHIEYKTTTANACITDKVFPDVDDHCDE